MEEHYTEDEIKAANDVLKQIIEYDDTTLKAILMSGQIIMWAQLEAENKELKEKIKRVEDSLMSDEEMEVSFRYIYGASKVGAKHQRDLTLKALEG